MRRAFTRKHSPVSLLPYVYSRTFYPLRRRVIECVLRMTYCAVYGRWPTTTLRLDFLWFLWHKMVTSADVWIGFVNVVCRRDSVAFNYILFVVFHIIYILSACAWTTRVCSATTAVSFLPWRFENYRERSNHTRSTATSIKVGNLLMLL